MPRVSRHLFGLLLVLLALAGQLAAGSLVPRTGHGAGPAGMTMRGPGAGTQPASARAMPMGGPAAVGHATHATHRDHAAAPHLLAGDPRAPAPPAFADTDADHAGIPAVHEHGGSHHAHHPAVTQASPGTPPQTGPPVRAGQQTEPADPHVAASAVHRQGADDEDDPDAPCCPDPRGCLLCPICLSGLAPPVVLAVPPVLPGPVLRSGISVSYTPADTDPPIRFILAAHPRGPPAWV